MQQDLKVSDLTRLTSFSSLYGPQFTVTQDGKALAFCALNAGQTERKSPALFLAGGERGVLYIVAEPGAKPLEVCLPHGFGAFSPMWSPDGRYLAVVLTDAQTAHPAIYDVTTQALSICCDNQIALIRSQVQFKWIDTDTVTFAALPLGQSPSLLTLQTRALDALGTMWETAKTAAGPTYMAFATDQTPPTADPLAIYHYNASTQKLSSPQAVPDSAQASYFETWARPYPAPKVASDSLNAQSGTLEFTDPKTQTNIIVHRDNTGTSIHWQFSGNCVVVATFDTHLQGLKTPHISRAPYGEQATKERLYERIANSSQKAAPVLIEIYPDQMIAAKSDADLTINKDQLLHTATLATSGLQIIQPALPLRRSEGRVVDLLEDLVQHMQDLVSDLIATEVATPGNIHLYGHSWGGWAVPMLLAKSDHFASGIASAGLYDLAGFHLQNDPRTRFDRVLRPCLLPSFLETEYNLPPAHWTDPQAYARLSPIYQVNQITAPLLMLHGDIDYVQVTGAEAMLNAMRFAGQTAELIRYGGEEHILSNPHNIADYFARIADFVWTHAPSTTSTPN